MDRQDILKKLTSTLYKIEEDGDIVITTTSPKTLSEKIFNVLHKDINCFVNKEEYSAILNCLNVLIHNIHLDEDDFQTIIGIDKEELKAVHDKLRK